MKNISDTARKQVIEFVKYALEHKLTLKLSKQEKERIAKLIKDYKITEQELDTHN